MAELHPMNSSADGKTMCESSVNSVKKGFDKEAVPHSRPHSKVPPRYPAREHRLLISPS